jgi:transglutaminase-like putative cysteine protease
MRRKTILFGCIFLAAAIFATDFYFEPLAPVPDTPAITTTNTRIITLFETAPIYTAFNPESCKTFDGSPYQKQILPKHPSVVKLARTFENSGLELIEEIHDWVVYNIVYKKFLEFRSIDIILQSGYADCTGKSNLLAALLENQGFDAYVAYTKTHAFVVVKHKEIWYSIDATSNNIWSMYNWKKPNYIHYMDVLGIYNSKGAARC